MGISLRMLDYWKKWRILAISKIRFFGNISMLNAARGKIFNGQFSIDDADLSTKRIQQIVDIVDF